MRNPCAGASSMMPAPIQTIPCNAKVALDTVSAIVNRIASGTIFRLRQCIARNSLIDIANVTSLIPCISYSLRIDPDFADQQGFYVAHVKPLFYIESASERTGGNRVYACNRTGRAD